LARFERHEPGDARDLPALVETTAEELGRSLEVQVREILRRAEAQAAAIEHDAQRIAREHDRRQEQRAAERTAELFARAQRVVDSIDLIQGALRGMLSDLRAELESARVEALTVGSDATLAAAPETHPIDRLTAAAPAPPAPVEHHEEPQTFEQPVQPTPEQPPQPAPEQPPHRAPEQPEVQQPQQPPAAQPEQPEVQQPEQSAPAGPQAEPVAPEPEQSGPQHPPPLEPNPGPAVAEAPPAEPAEESVRAAPPSGASDAMIHEQIRQMLRQGTPRSEVERFLKQFDQGGDYIEMLDQVYPRPSGTYGKPRRRFLRRLRRR
jgi:hypothetical protein